MQKMCLQIPPVVQMFVQLGCKKTAGFSKSERKRLFQWFLENMEDCQPLQGLATLGISGRTSGTAEALSRRGDEFLALPSTLVKTPRSPGSTDDQIEEEKNFLNQNDSVNAQAQHLTIAILLTLNYHKSSNTDKEGVQDVVKCTGTQSTNIAAELRDQGYELKLQQHQE
ncbi:hypothetical protein E2320_006881 [Naja naja]|nr:hypothetical protein E2320_006881 [Naja naja]